MQLAGLQKTTLVDFPGKVAATVFTRGCSFRCHFCHNPELVLPEQFLDQISERDFFDFLTSRLGKLQGVCVTGGEPLLHPDVDKFISHIKALGFAVKLDTNGSFPDRLEKIIKDGDVNYIAMDIKSPLHKYEAVTNSKLKSKNSKLQLKTENLAASHCEEADADRLTKQSNPLMSSRAKPRDLINSELSLRIKKSIGLIMSSRIDYEFRTTVCHPLHEVDDFSQIGKMIKGAKRYYIQNFVQSKHINPKIKFKPFSESELKKAAKRVEKYVKKVDIR
jgi:pyruvate formate lyase activating enzyme